MLFVKKKRRPGTAGPAPGLCSGNAVLLKDYGLTLAQPFPHDQGRA